MPRMPIIPHVYYFNQDEIVHSTGPINLFLSNMYYDPLTTDKQSFFLSSLDSSTDSVSLGIDHYTYHIGAFPTVDSSRFRMNVAVNNIYSQSGSMNKRIVNSFSSPRCCIILNTCNNDYLLCYKYNSNSIKNYKSFISQVLNPIVQNKTNDVNNNQIAILLVY
jgi:hypothetical protein